MSFLLTLWQAILGLLKVAAPVKPKKLPPPTPIQPTALETKKAEAGVGANDTDADVIEFDDAPIATIPDNQTPWMVLARADDGTREIVGPKDNPKVVKYFADAGHSWVKDDETAWCAAFVGAMLERAGYASSKSLAARSYLQWGKKLDKPREGCIAVFWRGSPNGWQGHVGFYVGEDRTHVFVLGGNQSNAVNVSRYPKSKLLGYRWPITGGNSRTITAARAGIAGIATSAIVQLSNAILPFANEMKALGTFFPALNIVGTLIALLAFGIVIYARIDDLMQKGR